jgi:hypothetical protein
LIGHFLSSGAADFRAFDCHKAAMCQDHTSSINEPNGKGGKPMLNRLLATAGIAAASFAVTVAAHAQERAQTPTFSGNAWVAIGIIVGLVLLLMLLISGVIGVSSRGETADDDGGGLPLFETDEEDDKPKKRRR